MACTTTEAELRQSFIDAYYGRIQNSTTVLPESLEDFNRRLMLYLLSAEVSEAAKKGLLRGFLRRTYRIHKVLEEFCNAATVEMAAVEMILDAMLDLPQGEGLLLAFDKWTLRNLLFRKCPDDMLQRLTDVCAKHHPMHFVAVVMPWVNKAPADVNVDRAALVFVAVYATFKKFSNNKIFQEYKFNVVELKAVNPKTRDGLLARHEQKTLMMDKLPDFVKTYVESAAKAEMKKKKFQPV